MLELFSLLFSTLTRLFRRRRDRFSTFHGLTLQTV